MSEVSDQTLSDSRAMDLETVMEQSIRDLMLLADFYEGHGQPGRAGNLYRLIRKIRDLRSGADLHSAVVSPSLPPDMRL